MKASIFLTILLLIIPDLFSQTETITWVTLDAPPYFILSGPDRNSGIGDRIMALLQDKLPEYTHKIQPNLPVSRIIQLQKEGSPVVLVTTLWSKEKEDYLYFSLPTVINPPTVLVTLQKKADRFSASDTVSLKDLLQRPDLRLGLADRNYGEPLDSLLSSGKGNIHRRMGSNVFTGLLEMIDLGRVDYILGTPYEVAYAQKNYPNPLQLKIYSLGEIGEEQYLLSYAAFPKNPWGLSLRDKVNKILREQRLLPSYRKNFTDWLDPFSAGRLNAVWSKYME